MSPCPLLIIYSIYSQTKITISTPKTPIIAINFALHVTILCLCNMHACACAFTFHIYMAQYNYCHVYSWLITWKSPCSFIHRLTLIPTSYYIAFAFVKVQQAVMKHFPVKQQWMYGWCIQCKLYIYNCNLHCIQCKLQNTRVKPHQ